MQYLREHFLETIRFLLLAACALSLLTACGAKKMSGTFVGEAKASLKPVNSSSDIASDVSSDSSRDALAILTQDGDVVTLRFSNTALLKDCELKAKFTKGTADIADSAICETDIAGLSRVVTVTHLESYFGDSEGTEITIRPLAKVV